MGTYAFGAAAGHALVEDALAEGTRRAASLRGRTDVTDLEVLRSTGASMLSDVFHAGRLEGKYEDVDFFYGDTQIPPNVHAPCAGGDRRTFGAYAERTLAHATRQRRRATHDDSPSPTPHGTHDAPSPAPHGTFESYVEPSPAPTTVGPTEMMGSTTVVVASSVVFSGVDVASWSGLDDAIFASAVTSEVAALTSETQMSKISVSATSRRLRRLHFASAARVAFSVTLRVDDAGDAAETVEVWSVVSPLVAALRTAVTTDASGATPLDAAIAAAAVGVDGATVVDAAIDSASSLEAVSVSTYEISYNEKESDGNENYYNDDKSKKRSKAGELQNKVIAGIIFAVIAIFCCCRCFMEIVISV